MGADKLQAIKRIHWIVLGVLCAVVGLYFTLNLIDAYIVDKEVKRWDRSDLSDICLPLPVTCGRLEDGRQKTQCDLIKATVTDQNLRVARKLKSKFKDFEPPKQLFVFEKRARQKGLKHFVEINGPAAVQLKEGALCYAEISALGKQGVTRRVDGRYFEINICFNKFREVKKISHFPTRKEQLQVERMNRYGPMLAVAHEMHHAWIGQGNAIKQGHPETCQLMCKNPKGLYLSDTALTILKRVLDKCRK